MVLVLLLAVVWFGGLDHRKLVKPDEGRYAEIPREMVATGDWLTPRLTGLAYFEKPPLQYWTTAAAYEAFGIHEWTSRLWTATTGFLGVLLVGLAGARLFDRRAGLGAATVLASSVGYVLLGHFNTLDMGLAFFTNATLVATLLARRARATESPAGHCAPGDARRSVAWMLLAWTALALAVLSKGPVALVLCGGALVLYLMASRDWALLTMLAPVRGLAVFLVIAAPWFIAVSRANPGFAEFFFIHEHVERFLTTEHRREGAPWYFVPVLLVGVLPWIAIVAKGCVRGWNAPRTGTFAPGRLLLAWCVGVFAFFSLSGSKLPSYVLPMFPALALLAGRALADMDARALRRHAVVVCACAVVATIAAFVALPGVDFNASADARAAFRTGATASLAALALAAAVAAWLASRHRRTASVIALGAGALVAWSALLLAHEPLGRAMSTYDLANAMRPYLANRSPVYSVGLFEHSLPFYIGRTVVPVAFRDELDYGLDREPHKGVATLVEFQARWRDDRAPIAVIDRSLFDKMAAVVPMRSIADDGRRIAAIKPDPTDPAAVPAPLPP